MAKKEHTRFKEELLGEGRGRRRERTPGNDAKYLELLIYQNAVLVTQRFKVIPNFGGGGGVPSLKKLFHA